MTDPDRGPKPLNLEDNQLVQRVQAGQVEIFGELVHKYADRVFNTCWRICGNLEDARDLTQETFLRAYEQINGFGHRSAFYTWLYRLAVNLSLTHRRKSASRQARQAEQAQHTKQRADRPSGGGHSGEPEGKGAQQSDVELETQVSRALQQLDDEQRVVVVLRDLEGLDYEEITAILKIPRGTVKSRLHRARLALRDLLLPWVQQRETG